MPNKSRKTRARVAARAPAPRPRPPTTFGPVTTINTAPVAIGNSIRGSQPVVTNMLDGARVVGRDFVFAMQSTATAITGWTCVGGFPLTPSVMPSSILRNYCQTYAKFKVNAINVHYITSSPTSQAGDVLFYYERDRNSSMIDSTNNSFLPYVLSDKNTILGPQWQNHTLTVKPTDTFNLTNYGTTTDLNEDACGSVFIFSKTASASSAGYVLIDYDLTFKELSVNPRAGVLPVSRGQWNNFSFGGDNIVVVSGTTTISAGLNGNTLAGIAAALPNGCTSGDIYKVFFDVTNSQVLAVWSNVTAANFLVYQGATVVAATIDDGFTAYLLYSGTSFYVYPNLASAITQSSQMRYGVTATISYRMNVWGSLVYSDNGQTQASY